MRALIFLVAIVLILALIGWISFSSSTGRSSINLETQQIEQDTDRALESGAELLKKAGESVDSSMENDSERIDSTATPPVDPPTSTATSRTQSAAAPQ